MSKQIPDMKILSPNGSTKFCFLFGNEITHSPSPSIHTQWFMQFNFNVVYLPCQVQNEQSFKNIITSLLNIDNFHGANITMPFKSLILDILQITHSDAVKATGAANTLYKNQSNNWCLENTDVYGIKKTIQSLVPSNYNLIVLGGGGAAASCIYFGTYISQCKQIICFTRNPEKTLHRFPSLSTALTNKKLQILSTTTENINKIKALISNNNYNVIVNSIPPENELNKICSTELLETNEQAKESLFIELTKILPVEKLCYFDMSYRNTFNLQYSKDNGIKCADGMLMLKEQARESFFLWTGVRP